MRNFSAPVDRPVVPSLRLKSLSACDPFKGGAMRRGTFCTFLIALAVGLGAGTAFARAVELKARADDGNLGLGFKSDYAEVNGVKVHYVEGGAGRKTLLLIPGWPQTWYVWRKVMPELAKDYRVIAVDTRGMGDSSRPESGYDTATSANDLSVLMRAVGVDHYSVICHDVGMWIAYPL